MPPGSQRREPREHGGSERRPSPADVADLYSRRSAGLRALQTGILWRRRDGVWTRVIVPGRVAVVSDLGPRP